MTKETGLGDRLFVGGYDLSGDIGAIQTLQKIVNLVETTGLDKSAVERLTALEDGELAFANYFNPETNPAQVVGVHEVLGALPYTDRLASYFRGTALGTVTASVQGKQLAYGYARGADGSLTGGNINIKANGFGIEFGRAMTAGIHESTAPESLDPLDGNDEGFTDGSDGQAIYYVHVFEITGIAGDDITLTIEHSDDDGVLDPYGTLVATAEIDISAAPYVARLTVAGPVKRYTRITVSTTDGFTSAKFAVAQTRHGPATAP